MNRVLSSETSARLPEVGSDDRQRMLACARTVEVHSALLDDLPFLDTVEVGAAPSPRALTASSARIVFWNMERGRFLDPSARLLSSHPAAVYLLCELDRGMARSEQRDTPVELARRLGCGHAFGVEYLELGLGNAEERARHAGEANQVGYHGAALLSPHEIARPALVRLDRSGCWFDGERGERRVGGRLAMLGTLTLADTAVTLACVHLESHTDPAHRDAQFARLLDAVDTYAPGTPALIAGDVNTSSLGRAETRDRDALRALLQHDPGRLMNPVPHEPLFSRAETAGYDWRACNDTSRSTQRVKSPSKPGGVRLDWFFTRGLETRDPAVVPAVEAETHEALSDHEAIAVTIAVPASAKGAQGP